MTKDEAKKRVQSVLADAKKLLDEAARLMDEHQFSTTFMDNDYIPNGVRFVAEDGSEIDPENEDHRYNQRAAEEDLSWLWCDAYRYQYLAGKWKSSSDWMDC